VKSCSNSPPRFGENHEIKRIGEKGPIIDSITVAEFESHAELKEWLATTAPVFLRLSPVPFDRLRLFGHATVPVTLLMRRPF